MALNTKSDYRFTDLTAFNASGAQFLGESSVFHHRSGEAKKQIKAEDLLWLGEALMERNYWLQYPYLKYIPDMDVRGKISPVINDFKTLGQIETNKIRADIKTIFTHPAHAWESGYSNPRFVINQAKANALFPVGTVVKFSSRAEMAEALKSVMEAESTIDSRSDKTLDVDAISEIFEEIRRAGRIVTDLDNSSVGATAYRGTYNFEPDEKFVGYTYQTLCGANYEPLLSINKSAPGERYANLEPYNLVSADAGLPYKMGSHAFTGWTLWMMGKAKGVAANGRITRDYSTAEYEHSVLRVTLTQNARFLTDVIARFLSFYGFAGTSARSVASSYAAANIPNDPAMGFPVFEFGYETIGQEIGSDFFRAVVT